MKLNEALKTLKNAGILAEKATLKVDKYAKLINKSTNLDELISALQVVRDNMGSIPVNFEDTSISITNWDDEWNLWIESDGVE